MHPWRKCSAFKVVLSALLLVALLQLLYLSFLSTFHGKQQRYRYSELFGGNKDGHPENDSRKERLRHSLSTGGVFDNSGQYRVYKNLIKSDLTANTKPGSDPAPAPNALALATHTTLNNLHHLESLVERWQSPLSVAIFAHGQDVRLATALAYALSIFCHPIRALVDFHLVCPSGETASFPERDREHFAGLEDCASVFSRLGTYRDERANYAIGGDVPYPNNLLRNVARGGTAASYVLVIDMDMVPSGDLHQRFLALLERRGPAAAAAEVFVLPAFEIRHARKMPATKAELVQLYQVGEVRPFYEELCPRCHAPTNYSRWVNSHARDAGALEVAYVLGWVYPWEPLYIGPHAAPLYDENFKQYGFNRISQACELHVAGYQFPVLSSAFVVHRGFKIKGEFHARKDEENKRNKLLFHNFKEGLKSKYPSSDRRC
ncbi:beta-1,4-glucuronyltransferase 1 [Brachionichthys hirsutus]|uniref:beta-1,4-glucuronyltransferase 1 n=1 Tax=Brachionichthys hirsutus TaxID=412623 RepID=UPI00360449DD